MDDIDAIVKGLSKAQRAFLRGRHSETGNPWPYIRIGPVAVAVECLVKHGD